MVLSIGYAGHIGSFRMDVKMVEVIIALKLIGVACGQSSAWKPHALLYPGQDKIPDRRDVKCRPNDYENIHMDDNFLCDVNDALTADQKTVVDRVLQRDVCEASRCTKHPVMVVVVNLADGEHFVKSDHIEHLNEFGRHALQDSDVNDCDDGVVLIISLNTKTIGLIAGKNSSLHNNTNITDAMMANVFKDDKLQMDSLVELITYCMNKTCECRKNSKKHHLVNLESSVEGLSAGESRRSLDIGLGVGLSSVIIALIAIVLYFVIRRRKNARDYRITDNEQNEPFTISDK